MLRRKNDVIIPGDFTIKCGDIVQCDFPQLKGGREQEINRQSGGNIRWYCLSSNYRKGYTDESWFG